MTARALRVGARTSRLARRQADIVIEALSGGRSERPAFVGIRTSGDLAPDVAIGSIGGTGVFTRELERAVLDHEIDAAVHSLKDVATRIPDGLAIAAYLPREDPRDVLVLSRALRDSSRTGEADLPGSPLDLLPEGSVVGTASLRRRAFLLRLRPDLRVRTIRGNVPTRLRKLGDDGFDAIVLAAAGLLRLGLRDEIAAVLDAAEFPPAPGQGAIAVQVRAEDDAIIARVMALDHPDTRTAVTAERAFLRRIEGGCQAPAGALAKVAGDSVTLTTLVCSPDGSRAVAASATGRADEAAAVGIAAADRALQDGAEEILAELRTPPGAAGAARGAEGPSRG